MKALSEQHLVKDKGQLKKYKITVDENTRRGNNSEK